MDKDRTQKKPQTIRGEEQVHDETSTEDTSLVDETSTHTRTGVIPSSYGAPGGMTKPRQAQETDDD